jgi:predicted RNase H-like HicB family nuclease
MVPLWHRFVICRQRRWAAGVRHEYQEYFPKTPREGKVDFMKFVTTLERDEDGVWVAECPSIPGCVSQGRTRDEALANIREAIAACLEVRAERGLPLTVETQQVEVAI